MAKHIVLSDGEWKLMKLLWENHPMTLGDMVEAMQDDTAWSKGTIFTMLRRMSTKGVIRMDDSGKYQQYYPVLQKEEAEQAETRSFLERVYDGSVGMMLSAMAHECKLSKSEIDELYEIIREAREEEKTDWIVGSSILIVMIFAIRKVFGMRISSRFRYALWAVVMIRLLCPVTLWNNQQLVHNITEVSRQMFQNTSGTKVDKVDSNAELGMENGQNAGVGDASNTDRTKNDYTGNVKNQNVNMGQQNEQEINQTENLKITLGHNVFNQTGKETTAQQPEENSQSKDSNSNIFHSIIAQLISIAPAIWLYGSIAAGCWFAIVNMRFYHMLMRSRKQIDSSRKLLVYQVSGLSSPCLFGIIHPAIYLKEETKLKDDQILMILQHEICHYQHKDHIWSVMRSLCVAVWWWNPLVWAAAAESKRDCEMACG